MGNLMCFYRKECCSLTFIPFLHIFIRVAEILSEPSLLENEQSQLSQPVLMRNSPAPCWACSSKSVSFLDWGALKWRIPPALSHQWETDMPGVILSQIKDKTCHFHLFELWDSPQSNLPSCRGPSEWKHNQIGCQLFLPVLYHTQTCWVCTLLHHLACWWILLSSTGHIIDPRGIPLETCLQSNVVLLITALALPIQPVFEPPHCLFT